MRKDIIIKTLFFLLMTTFLNHQLMAQLEVKDAAAPPYNPQSLIFNELLGEGVQITNVTFEGENSAVGFFNNGSNSIGLEDGILLTTGSVRTVGANIGVDEVGSVQASVDNGSTVQDADMASLADFSLFNISKYTITFIPSSDSISFRYVFASEEYPEFVCSDYNDIFGFFISGPGINGPYENNAENIALIPGTDIPVKINNVNSGVVGAEGTPANCQNGNGFLNFSEFYNDNDGTNNQPVFDGFLQVFTASAKVIPCSTYTIKLVVADQGDPQRDSGVFIEGKSFSSESIEVSVLTQSIDGTIIEGCTDASIIINTPSPVASDVNLNVNVFGTATENSDFSNLPPIIIPAGESSTSITIDALEDGIVEGLEEIFFEVQLNQCFTDTFSLLINDSQIPQPLLGMDTAACEGITLDLEGSINNGAIEPIVFETSQANLPIISPAPGNIPTELRLPLEVVGMQPLDLRSGIIQSVCLDIAHNRLQDLEIYLEAPGGQLIPLTTENGGTAGNYTNTCFTPDATVSIREGSTPFTGDFLPEGSWAKLWQGDSPTNGIWELVVIDNAFGFNGIVNNWSITFNPILEFQYAWQNANGLSCTDCPNPTITPTESTDYILTVQDNYGCTVTDTFGVTIFEPLAEVPTVTCTNQTFDALSFEWNAITGAVGYETNVDGVGWNAVPNGQTTFTINDLALDQTVNLAVRAIGNCNNTEATASCTTLNCTEITLDNQEIQNITCNGANDGRIRVTAAGDNVPFNYILTSINEINDTGIFENLSAGEYTVQVTDTLNCSNSFDFTITEPEPLVLTPMTIANIGCDGEDGSGTVTIAGGTAPYTFNWSTGQADSIFTTAMGGNYLVTVTDANNCEANTNVIVGGYIPLSLGVDLTATCQGENIGVATLNITRGTQPYSYQWDAATGNQTTATANNLAEGTYEVTITDNNNCGIDTIISIEALDSLRTPLVSCASITETEITFAWTPDPNASDFEVNVDNGGWVTTGGALTYTVSNLSLDQTVEIQVRGVGACTPRIGIAACTTIDCSPIDVTPTPTNVTCFGETDGRVVVVATGNNGPFTYSLNGSSNTTGVFENLPSGAYIADVEDALGCVGSSPFSINEPEAISVITNLLSGQSCDNNGRAEAIVSGGTAPFNFLWSNGESVATAINLDAGTQTVTITDANNCTTNASVEIAAYLPMTSTVASTDDACGDMPSGTASITVQGGNPTYSYLWSDVNGQQSTTASNLPAGNYTVTVTDADNCEITAMVTVNAPSAILIDSIIGTNTTCSDVTDGAAIAFISGGTGTIDYTWSNNESTNETINNLGAGTYNLTIRDELGCEASNSVTIMTPTEIAISNNTVNLQCSSDANASIEVAVTGGTPNYTYQWTNGETTANISNLAAGNYLVTVTDANNCTSTFSETIQAPNPLSINLTTNNIQCANTTNGRVMSEVGGGVGAYTYLWSTGANSADLSNLGAGTYDLTITDENNCEVSASASLIAPDSIAVSTDIMQPICVGETGSIAFMITGGTQPFTAQLNGNNLSNTNQAEQLVAGTYNLVIQDANNCTVEATDLVINEIIPVMVQLGEDQQINLGESLTLTPEVSNGVPPYTFNWVTTDDTSIDCLDCESPTVTPYNNTAYTLDIIDANGCSSIANVNVRVTKNRNIYAPNAFSPDSDGINDFFTLQGRDIGVIRSLRVFDRWGNKVFDKQNIALNDLSAGWNGTFRGQAMQPDVFAWFAEIEFIDGVVEVISGDLTLVR